MCCSVDVNVTVAHYLYTKLHNVINDGQGQIGKTGKDGRPGEPGEQVGRWPQHRPSDLVPFMIRLMLSFYCRASTVNPGHQATLGSGESQ